MHVTLELLDKFVEPLTSFMWAHDLRLHQYHNSILNSCEWCTHDMYYSWATYYIICKMHEGQPLKQASTNTLQCSIHTLLLEHIYRKFIISYQTSFIFLNLSNAAIPNKSNFYHPKIKNLPEHMLHTHLISTGATLIIHALYMCAKSNVCILHCRVLVKAWFRGDHACILHVTWYIAHK